MASARVALQLRRHCIANPLLFFVHGLRYRKLEVILTTVTSDPTHHFSIQSALLVYR
jgi:hypothetical protein